MQSCFIVQENPAPGTGFGKAYGGKAYNMRNSIAAITTFFTPVWVERKMLSRLLDSRIVRQYYSLPAAKALAIRTSIGLTASLILSLPYSMPIFLLKLFIVLKSRVEHSSRLLRYCLL